MSHRNNDLEFGVSIFPWTKKYLSYFNDLKWFITVACFANIVQGAAHTYFNRTLHIWREQYGFSEQLAEWIIISNDIFQSVVAIFIIHVAKKLHRIKWIAGSLAFLAVGCFSLIIPELVHPLEMHSNQNSSDATFIQQYESRQMCHAFKNQTYSMEMQSPCWSSLFIMFVFQVILGISIASLYVVSVVYVDDHDISSNAIVHIGTLMAFKELGSYIGIYVSWISTSTQGSNIFVTGSWITIICLLLISAALIGLYPKYLYDIAITKHDLLGADIKDKQGLGQTLLRLITNKSVIFNILSATFLYAAINNFSLLENKFIQSKFVVTDLVVFHGLWISEVIISLLKSVIVFLIVLATGFLISKFNIRAFSIGIYNGVMPLLLVFIFLAYLGLGCNKIFLSEVRNKLIKSYCSFDCNCDQTLFEPICLDKKTYFSPCHAGCSNFEEDDSTGIKLYTECSCSIHSSAKPGGCIEMDCQQDWIYMEILRVAASAFLASMLVGHLLINLYSVNFLDRAHILAFELAVISFISYVPVRLIYITVTGLSCQYFGWNKTDCTLYETISFSRYMIGLTVPFLLLASIFSILAAFSVRTLDFDKNNYFLDTYHGSVMLETCRTNDDINTNISTEGHRYTNVPTDEPKREENDVERMGNTGTVQAEVHSLNQENNNSVSSTMTTQLETSL